MKMLVAVLMAVTIALLLIPGMSQACGWCDFSNNCIAGNTSFGCFRLCVNGSCVCYMDLGCSDPRLPASARRAADQELAALKVERPDDPFIGLTYLEAVMLCATIPGCTISGPTTDTAKIRGRTWGTLKLLYR